MNVYRVVTEVEEGAVHKEGHKSVQDLKQVNKYIVADNMEAVWEAIALDRLDEGIDILAIVKEHPIVQIIPSKCHDVEPSEQTE